MPVARFPFRMSDAATAAERLLGYTLEDGWVVTQKLGRRAGSTGGQFSISYLAERGSQQAFVKALDYAKAFQDVEKNTPAILQYMTAAFTFEKAVLERCRDKRMRRVALPITSGSIDIADAAPIARVDYLIMEVADRDVRAHIDALGEFDAAWCVRTLHQAATALRQLHAERIAHQDVKPSNFLLFEGTGAKITDFGRSSRQGYQSPHDEMDCAGDKGYSAPELLYGYRLANWKSRRIGNDIYMLGSLLYFFFAGTSVTAAIHTHLHPTHAPGKWGGEYATVLPYVREAFDRAVSEFNSEAEQVVPAEIAKDLTSILRELCEPDPVLRGDPKNRDGRRDQYSLERYVTRFNVIASRLEMRLKADAPAPRG